MRRAAYFVAGLLLAWAVPHPAVLAATPGQATVIEFESLARAAIVSGGATAVQPMAGFGAGWGGDAQLFWRAPAPTGDAPTLTVPFSVPDAGSYDLVLFHTVAPDYGRYTVFINGRPSSDVDGYGTGVALSRSTLGRHTLGAGRHQLEFRVTGRHPSSSGHIVGLDRLELTAVGTQPAGGAPVVMRLPQRIVPPPDREPPSAAPAQQPSVQIALIPAMVKWAAARPRLEARHPTTTCCPPRVEDGFDTRRVMLDWASANLGVTFRWQAGGEGVAQGRWEVYESPPTEYGRQDKPLVTGLVRLPDAGQWQSFNVDLAPLKPTALPQLLPSFLGGKKAAPEDIRPRLYIRVVAVNAAGQVVGLPGNTLVLTFDDEVAPGRLKPSTAPVPSVSIVRYDPVHPYTKDYLCWLVATKDGPVFWSQNSGKQLYRKGDATYICHSKSKSILGEFADFFVEAIGEFINSIGTMIDGVSALYSKLKSGVVDIVAGAFEQIGCGSPCRFAVQMALDAALASIGAPPSLPNFDQLLADLEKQGIDAVTKVVTEAAVSQGLPGALAEEAAKKAVTELVKEGKKAVAAAASGSKGGQVSDWVADPYRAYRPGRFLVKVTNWSDKPSAEFVLGLNQTNPKKVSVPMIPIGNGSFLTETVEVGGLSFFFRKIPSLQPGTSLLVEVVLAPIPDPHRWLDVYNNEPWRLAEKLEAACGRRSTADFCSGGNESAPQCERYKKYQACSRPFGDKQRETVGSAMRLKDAFVDVYGPGNDSFRLDVLPKNVGMSITTSKGVASVKYPDPTWQGKRVDACLGFSKQCGEPAAQLYCKLMGYPSALGAQQAQGLPPHTTTVTLDSKQACSGAHCAAFAEITCAMPAAAVMTATPAT